MPPSGDDLFVSIVVPTRNRADDLRVCLESLVAQDYPSGGYEVVVVDDGSTDSTAAVVTALPGVRLVRRPQGGSNAARNAGLDAAKGDPVVLVDDDVEAPPHWLAALVDGFVRYPDADAFAGPVRSRTDVEVRTCPQHPLASTLDGGPDDRLIDEGLGANMALRRRALTCAGPFDEWILIGGADTDWFNRLSDAGGRTMYIAGAGLWHRRSRDRLRVHRLLLAEFRRGAASHRFLIRRGRRSALPSLRALPALLAHAARARCAGALAQSARTAGAAYGLFRHRNLVVPDPPAPARDPRTLPP